MKLIPTILVPEPTIPFAQYDADVSARDAEIERLRARNKRLQSALNEFVAVCDTAPPVKFINEIERVVVFARAALED